MHFKSYLMFTASLHWTGILHWLKEPGIGKLKCMFYTTGIFDSKRLYKSYRGKKMVMSLESPYPYFTVCWSCAFFVSVANLAPYPMSYECLLPGTNNKTAYKNFTIKMQIFIQEVQIWWYQPSLKAITMRQRGHKPKSLAQSIWKQVSYKLPTNAVISIIAQKPPSLFKHSLDLRGTNRVFNTRPVSYFNKAIS